MPSDQRLVLAIIEYLNASIQDGSVKEDDKEGLEVAVQCIGEAFGVDPANETQVKDLSIKPATLQSVFDVFLKMKDKHSASSSSAATPTPKDPSDADKVAAEKRKAEGNSFMSTKDYPSAITAYTQAIELDPYNPIYHSNRAAAHSSAGDHLLAIGDAERAIQLDPKFVRAYHRLGHAQYSLSDYQGAAESFQQGLDLDPSNAGLKSGLENSQQRLKAQGSADVELSRDAEGPGAGAGAGGIPNLAGMADMLKNMGIGGAGGGGGMPDISAMMQNPQMMAMAQQLAQSGGLNSLMQNPAVAQMMNQMQSGQMPSMEQLMANPALRDLARQFGGAS